KKKGVHRWRCLFPTVTGLQFSLRSFVSRSAEQLLEFDRLKDIVSRYTTRAPGRRSTLALLVLQDSAALDIEFTLVREAVAYLRTGSELGFGSLADPEPCLARLIFPGS